MSSVAEDREPAEIDVFQPAVRAHELRLRGMSWPRIALEVGYESAGGIRLAVEAMLQQAATALAKDQRAAALELELERLDVVLDSFWDKMTGGDVAAAGVVLRTLDQRARRLGVLDGLVSQAGHTRAVVISAMPGAYETQLQEWIDRKGAKAGSNSHSDPRELTQIAPADEDDMPE